MKPVEILKIIRDTNPSDEVGDSKINGQILKKLGKYNISNTTLNELGQKGYIKCKINGNMNKLMQGIWLTTDGRDKIERHEGIEKENSNLKAKIEELENEIRINKSILRHPFFVSISTAIFSIFLTLIITKYT